MAKVKYYCGNFFLEFSGNKIREYCRGFNNRAFINFQNLTKNCW